MGSSRVVLSLVCLFGCGGASIPSEPPPVPVESLPVLTALTVIVSAAEVPTGQKLTASATGTDERGRPMQFGDVAWSSSDTAIARVSTDGVILGLREGVASVIAVVGNVSARQPVRVGPLPPGPIPVAALVVRPFAVALQVGSGTRLSVALSDFAGRTLIDREIAWATSDTAIAIVSADGTVTARGMGVALIEATSEGIRGASQVTVAQAVDAGIVISMAIPMANDAVRDSITVVATVRAMRPLRSVVARIGGTEFPMTFGQIPRSTKGPAWSVVADVSSLPYGPISVLVTATDDEGKINVADVPIVRDPSLTPGSKVPPRSK